MTAPRIILLFFLASVLFAEEQQSDSEIWEESQAQKLHLEAKEFLREGAQNEAIAKLRELVEFFPDTSPWAQACLSLSTQYLMKGNPEASRELIERIELHEDKNIQRQVLLAYWDFYFKQQQFDKLVQWLQKRSEDEISLLRKSTIVQDSLIQLARANPEQLLELYSLLGEANPLLRLVEALRVRHSVLSKKQNDWLKQLALQSNNPSNIWETASYLSDISLYREADRMLQQYYKDNSEGREWIRSVWLPILIEGSLWERAEQVLKLVPEDQDLRREQLIILIGQSRFNEAYALIDQDFEWLSKNLSPERLQELLSGLAADLPNRSKAQKILNSMGGSNVSVEFQARLTEEENPKEAEKLYLRVIREQSATADLACVRLARLALRRMDFYLAREAVFHLRSRYPNSAYLPEAKDLLLKIEVLDPKKD